MKRICILLACLLIPFAIYAKGGKEHVQDMIDVYPFKVQDGDIIHIFFECVQAAIDYGEFNPKYQEKKTSNPLFLKSHPFEHTRWKNHRIWYHWGFNANVRLFPPLTSMVNENIERGLMKEEDRELFYQCLYKEIGKRNKELMRLAAEIFGYPSSGWSNAMREQLNAFVSIPYAVHLLGDRFEQFSETSIVQSMDDIVKSVYKAIDDLAGSENVQQAKELKNILSSSEKTPEEFLAALKNYLPKYMLSLKGGIYDINKLCRKKDYKIKGNLFFANIIP